MSAAGDLAAAARRTPLAGPDIHALAVRAVAAGEGGVVDDALDLLLAEGDPESAAALLLAQASRGLPVARARLDAVAPYVAGWPATRALVAACEPEREGRVALLAALAADRRIDMERACEAALTAVAALEGEPPPPALVSALRVLARDDLDDVAAEQVACCVQVLAAAGAPGKADLEWLAEPWLRYGPKTSTARAALLRAARDGLDAPVRKALPREAPDRTAAVPPDGAAAPKVGRNDPCPCGSGKKAKKCCGDKAPGATPPAAAEPRDPTGLGPEELAALPLATLLRLDLGRAGRAALVDVALALVDHRRLAEAEAALERAAALPAPAPTAGAPGADGPGVGAPDGAGAGAPSAPAGVGAEAADLVDRAWLDLVHAALAAGDVERVLRVAARVPEGLLAGPERALLEAVARRDPTLATLEEAARLALAAPTNEKAEGLARFLLEHLPATGVLVARGACDPDRAREADEVMAHVEAARDRLLLPAQDPCAALLDAELDHVLGDGRRSGKREDDDEDEAAEDPAAAERAALQARLQAATARVDALEDELRRERRAREREREAAAPRAASGDELAELKRLRTKVQELKDLQAEAVEERRALREEAERLRAALAAHEAEAEEAASAGAGDGEGEEELEAADLVPVGAERVPPLLPRVREAAERTLREVDAATARVTLRLVGRLAAGEPSAWGSVKRLRAAPDLWTARAGIHHRLLLRPDLEGGTLEVVDLIHRKDLEATIRRR